MLRKLRNFVWGEVYHVLNRASGRAEIFAEEADFVAFEKVLAEAVGRVPMRVLTYVIMPTHFHLVLWPKVGQGERVSEFMRWLTVTHTQRWHAHHHTSGTGHLYQGRFKAFVVQGGRTAEPWGAVRKVCRYVERNPLRARLVNRAEEWRWGGLWRRMEGTAEERGVLAEWPAGAYPGDGVWLKRVNAAQGASEEAALALSIKRGRPFGEAAWVSDAARRMGLEHTMRGVGRPPKVVENLTPFI